MIQPVSMFSADPGQIYDFSGKRPAEIFNESVIPKVNSFLDLLGDDPSGLEEARKNRELRLQQDLSREAFAKQQDDEFLSNLMERRNAFESQPLQDSYDDYSIGLDEPVAAGGGAVAPRQAAPPAASGQSPTQALANPAMANAPVAKSKGLVDFVKHFEGYSSKPFDDYKQMSIGYGTRAKKGETSISKEEAERRLDEELNKARAQVAALDAKGGYKFTDHERDALTSFAYNVGNINQLTAGGTRSREQIAAKMLEYRKAGGKVLPGLVRRRKAEQDLFLNGY